VSFPRTSDLPVADKLPRQEVIFIDFEKLGEAIRARPPPGDGPVDGDPVAFPVVCPPPHICAENCVKDPSCFRRPVPRESYDRLCGVVGCSAKKGAPVCLVGNCDGTCLCREEILTKLNVLLINDALGELNEGVEETNEKDEL
jgi:hypothetical protein